MTAEKEEFVGCPRFGSRVELDQVSVESPPSVVGIVA